MTDKFLSYFPNHLYRYIDLTGAGRAPQSSPVKKDELNLKGYESYFTVNGFCDTPNAQKASCSNLNSFFIDIDGRKDLAEIEAIKVKLDPSFITETKNGYHLYWLLDETIYKEEVSAEEWEASLSRWERIEQALVLEFKADPVVKDVTRILRVPDTFYWKKTGSQWEKGTDGVFKIKGIYKNTANTYSMADLEEKISVKEPVRASITDLSKGDKMKKMADAEKENFFEMVNEEYPIEERDSFKTLIAAQPNEAVIVHGRNNTLYVTACLMRQAGWTLKQAVAQIDKVGWHGMERETGGAQEILNTLTSAFDRKHSYSYKNPVISANMSASENQLIQKAYTKVMKDRREQDKIRFSNYEQELLIRHPFLRKNEVGIFFQYKNGVYRMMSDQEMSDIVLNGLYDDMLWGYRTKRNVSDKIACLLSIIPLLEMTDDKGYIANVKNGLLNIYTKELLPHDPNFVSLVQFPVSYDPTAACPVWDSCISDWMDGPEKEKKTILLQQFSGYCLSSSMLYDRALFMIGDGGNGKSTFIDTIAMIIGPDATSHIDLEDLYGDFGFHGLIGKRLNVIEEVSGNYYQSNKLKKLVSGELVTIKIKYKPQFTFRPQAKFAFSLNMMPRVDDTSTATERRILCLQFLRNYRDNPNTSLRSSVGLLSKELSGILNWMVDGAISLSNDGRFVQTEEQTLMLNEYREENSSVEGFISQCIVLNEFSYIETPDLYEEYKQWSQTDGGRKMKSNITFTKEVKAYGAKGNRFRYEPRGKGAAEARFEGIELSPQWKKQSRQGGLSSKPVDWVN